MSEHAPRHEQHRDNHEQLVGHEQHERAEKQRSHEAHKAAQEKAKQNIEHIREVARQHAAETHAKLPDVTRETDTDSLLGMQQSLKETAYKRTLARTQQQLSKPARTFSKFVHNGAVDKVSTVTAKTAMRPSGILGGSLVAFVGSVGLLYTSKHYGFRYNYLLLFGLFVGGFILGASIELVVWLVYSRKKRY